MSRPRILFLTGNAPPAIDGVGDYTDRLLEELTRQRPDWRWWWLSRRPRWFSSPFTRRGRVRLIRPGRDWGVRSQQLAATAVRLLRPDIIHVQEELYSFHETDAASSIVGRLDAPAVTTLHEFHTDHPRVAFTKQLVSHGRVVIANDPRTADRCLAETGRAVDHLWWSGPTITPPTRRPPVRPGLLVTFGFLSALKQLDLVHQALRMVRAAHPERDIRWRIIGPFEPLTNPDHAALERAFANDRNWIGLTGAVVDRDRLRSLLAEAELMLLPFADGASTRRTTLHTAWAFGAPSITTSPREPTDAIRHDDNVWIVSESTPEAWCFAIDRVLTDHALADRLRSGGLATAEQFPWPRLAAEHIAMYEALLAPRLP
jgi:glycosyltransferase involved in cell wall biosynthesis